MLLGHGAGRCARPRVRGFSGLHTAFHSLCSAVGSLGAKVSPELQSRKLPLGGAPRQGASSLGNAPFLEEKQDL